MLECGKMLYENGYDIKILNTINFKKSMKYNPFAYLRIEKDILKLVQTIIANTKGDVLKGVSGSTGIAVGKVCLINSPKEFYKMKKGDILVCHLTDPEWTPLFKLASAVVADTGSALSHAAIVAREYNIPAVLGVGFATTKFKDGDTIQVDGNTGEVKGC